MELKIFGHKSPDTDSICSSIALTYLKNQLGESATAYRLGEVRKEAKYVLNYFKVDAPVLLEKVCSEDNCFLVDHNEYAQSVDGLQEANLIGIVDHHKLGGISTTLPLSVRIAPVGCTCTIIYNLFKENNVEITYEIAGLLLSAILSDTLLYKSPTTTQADIDACKALAEITKVDVETYAMDMFKYGTSLDGMSIPEIVHMDFKEFTIAGNKVGIGQVFTMDLDSIMAKKQEYIDYLESSEYFAVVLAITDIIKEGSYLLYKADNNVISDAFELEAAQGVFAPGVVSRKKQLVPNLTSALEK
ncbi:MAG: manganese-dependent inorganic pyrophosphatase [Clostridioides sp.]|jgi:manganese-dependent inorganic pyrophosphatase|nr:manganese-dependent inorganic pyrophosphatase [Clostridioides sp.]